MFNVGAGEMIVIALILLMAVGPEQLPGLIRRVGRTVSEVKGMTEGLRAEFMSGLEEIERATDPEAWAAGNEPSKVKPRSGPVTTTPAADAANGAAADQVPAENAESSDADSDQAAANEDPVEQAAIDEDPVEQAAADEDPVEQVAVDEDPVEQVPGGQGAAEDDAAENDLGDRDHGAGETPEAIFGDTAPPVHAAQETGQEAESGDDEDPSDPEREAEPEETT